MANFLGPSYGSINADSNQPLFNEVIGYNYDYTVNYDGVTSLDFRKTSSEQQVSISFVLNAARSVSGVDIWMQPTVLLSGNITANIYIEGASVGIPNTGVSLGASAAVDASLLTIGSYNKVKFTWASPVALNAGQNYYIVLTSTVGVSATDYLKIASDATPVGYLRSAKFNGTVWAAQTYHSCFIVYYKATTNLAQSFRVSGNQTLDQVTIIGAKTGSPSGSLYIEIRDDSSGSPALTGPTNNISNTVAVSSFTTTATFTFPTRPLLQDGHTYHIVLRTTGTFTSAAYVQWSTDASSPTFLEGTVSIDNADGTWRQVSQDSIFSVYYLEQVAPNLLSDELSLLGDPPTDCRAQQVWLRSLVALLSTFQPDILPPLLGGTGAGAYDVGDMLYATSASHLERLPIGVTGQFLAVDVGGLPSWSGAGGGSLAIKVLNNTGSSVSLGDVVVFKMTATNPPNITTTVKVADRTFAGIVNSTVIADGDMGVLTILGITQVRVQGSVVVGDYLDTCTTARRAQAASTGPIRALQAGGSGSLVWAEVNPVNQPYPYSRFSEVQAFNVNSINLVASTWATVPLNTSEFNSHSGLYSLAINQITFAQAGTYRLHGAIPFSIPATGSTTCLTRIRRVSGTPADLLIGQTTAELTTGIGAVSLLDGEITVAAGDAIELQAISSSTPRTGTAHGFTGFSNRYSTLEFWKIKD